MSKEDVLRRRRERLEGDRGQAVDQTTYKREASSEPRTYFPPAEDRVSKLKSTDRKYGALLRVKFDRGTITDEERSDYFTGVQEGLFPASKKMDKRVAGFGDRARALQERDKTGLTGLDRQFYDTQFDQISKGAGGRTFAGETLNAGSFGNADRLTAAIDRTGIKSRRGSAMDLKRRMAADMEAGGYKGDASLASQRRLRASDREANPLSAMGGEMAGYLAPGAIGMKLTTGVARAGATRLGISAMSRNAAPVGTTMLGRGARYAKDVLPRAAAGGAVDGALYGATVDRSNVEGREQRNIEFFSAENGSLTLKNAGYGALFGALASPAYRAVRGATVFGTDLAKDLGNKVMKREGSLRAGGKKGLEAAEFRMTPKDRRQEVMFENMQRAGLSVADAQYVRKALDEGRLDDAKKVMNPAYTKALIMIDKRLRAENIPVEALENKMREIAYAGEDINEFFFEIAALAGSGKTQALANALATVPGPGKNIAVKEFDDRGLDAFENVKTALNKAFGMDGTEYYKIKEMTGERGAKLVNEAYERAEANGALTDETWGKLIDDSPGMSPIREQGMRKGVTGGATLADAAGNYAAGQELRRIGRFLEDGDKARQMLEDGQLSGDQGLIDAATADLQKANDRLAAHKPSVSAFKYIDQEMTDIRYKANQPGSEVNPRGIAMTQDKIRGLTDAETQLKEARDLNAKFEFADKAFKEGRSMFKQGTDIETLVSAFERAIAKYDGMSPEIAPALVMGFIRGAEDAAATSGGIGTVLRRLHGTPRSREKLAAMLEEAQRIAKEGGAKKGALDDMTKARKALVGGNRKVTYVNEDGTPGTRQATVRAPGRIAREASMQDSKNRTIRGSGTAERLTAVREQDVFEDTVGEVIGDIEQGVQSLSGLGIKYGTAIGRRVARSGIYEHDVNKALSEIMFRGGRKHHERTIENLKRLRAARTGKGELDLLSPADKQSVINVRPTAPIANAAAGKKRIGRAAGVPAGPPTSAGVAPKRISARAPKVSHGQNPTFNTRGNGFIADYAGERLGRGAMAAGAVGVAPMPESDDEDQNRQMLNIKLGAMAVAFVAGFASKGGNARGASGVKGNMFIGINAKNADRDAAARAEKMLSEGVDPDQVKLETGWFREDGKMKSEISDAKSNTRSSAKARMQKFVENKKAVLDGRTRIIKEKVENGSLTAEEAAAEIADVKTRLDKELNEKLDEHAAQLGRMSDIDDRLTQSHRLDEVLDHPELFENYPELRDTTIMMQGGMDDTHWGSAYEHSDGRRIIEINKNADPERKWRTILHEVMHHIQKIEGFEPGGDPMDWRFAGASEAIKLAKVLEWAGEADKLGVNDYDYIWKKVEETMAGYGNYIPNDAIRYGDIKQLLEMEAGRAERLLKVHRPRKVDYDAGKYVRDDNGNFVWKHEVGQKWEADGGYKVYRRLKGEEEARNVEGRSEYSLEQTRRISTRSSSDVPRDDEILRQSDFGSSGRSSLSASAEEGHAGRVSTRVPTAKGDVEDHIGQKLTISTDQFLADPKLAQKAVDKIHTYSGFARRQGEKPAQTIKRFQKHVKDNLLFLYDGIAPEIRERSAKWYKGARKVVDDWTTEYQGLQDTQVAAVIAALSPQNEWNNNVSIAKRVIDTFQNQMDTSFSPEMEAISKKVAPKAIQQQTLNSIRGKTLAEAFAMGDYEAAMWIRLYDEGHGERAVRSLSPEGEFGDYMRTGKGEPAAKRWNSFGEVSKAISVLRNPTAEVISDALGQGHKVRNFYNNILDPDAQLGDVTIDTHAAAAAHLRPFSSNDEIAVEAMRGIGHAQSGSSGLYGIYADAYREAAADRGVLPREMQSVTWEAVKTLFTPGYKAGIKGKKKKGGSDPIQDIWLAHERGDISADDARRQIFEAAGGTSNPGWAKPGSGDGRNASSRNSSVEEGVAGAGGAGSSQPPRVGRVRGGKRDAASGMGEPAGDIAASKSMSRAADVSADDGQAKERAKAQGFDVDRVLYHRTSKSFDQFSVSDDGPSGPAIWLGSDPANLQQLHNRKDEGDQIIDVYSKAKSPLLLDEFNIQEMRDRWANGSKEFPFYLDPKIKKRLEAAGFDSIEVEDIFGDGGVNETLIFNKNDVRSTRAAYDPEKAESPILTAGFAPSFKDMGKSARSAEGKVVDVVSDAIEGGRRMMAGPSDPRHYGKRLSEYGIPDEVDPNRNIYNQAENYGDIAADVAERTKYAGGEQSGRLAMEEVGRSRSRRRARAQEREERSAMNQDRAEIPKRQKAAQDAAAAAQADVDAFYGETGDHTRFKTQAAKRKEYVSRQREAARLRRAADEAAQVEMPPEGDMPPEFPADREQRMLQEVQRVERDGVPMSFYGSEATDSLPEFDPVLGASSKVKQPAGGYAPVPTRIRTRRKGVADLRSSLPKGKDRRIEENASGLVMDPTRSSEAAEIARAHPNGFKPSRRVARGVTYAGGAAAFGAGVAGYGLMAADYNDRHRRVEEIDDFEPGFMQGVETRTPLPEISALGFQDAQAAQKDLNFAMGAGLDTDGKFGRSSINALKEFQRQEGLPVNGNPFDPATKKRLAQIRERRQFSEERQWQEDEARRLARVRAEPLPN